MQTKNFTVYKSSAGSGKTFTLVKQYLHIVLLDPNKFRNVLAITFTNKAANEMKERIIGSLHEIATYSSFPETVSVRYMLPDLEKTTGLSKNDLAQNAEKALQLILHNYNEFAVSTIDSFVHKVIRSFAFDLHLPLNFEVEINVNDLIVKIVDLLISRVGADEQLTNTLISFTEAKAVDEKSWNIERDLVDTAKLILNEEGQKHIEKIKHLDLKDFARINKQLNEAINKFETKISTIATKAFNLIKSKGLTNQAFYQGRSGIGSYFEKLSVRNFENIHPNSYVTKTIDEDKWFAGKSSIRDQAAIDEIKPELITYYHQLQETIQNHYPSYITLTEIRKNIYPLAVLNEIEKMMEEYKSENDVVLISEFNKKISEVVLNEPVPFIYERIGEKYKHFLLDEFQDTSILQWQNLLPLIDNSLAEGHFNMVVGDGKQAIYRWRNGEVEQFDKLPEIYKRADNPVQIQQEESLKRNFENIPLLHNYRSKDRIVDFNNDFFTIISNQLPDQYKSIYQDLIQKPNDKSGGYIHIEYQDENSPLSFPDFNLVRIKDTIAELLANGYQYCDMAILCRKNSEASLSAAELLKENIPVVSAESLLLNNSPEIRFLIALIKNLVNDQDKVAQTEIITYLSQTDRIKGDLHDNLEEFGVRIRDKKNAEPFPDFHKTLSSYAYDLNAFFLLNLSAYDLCEELVRKFNLNKSVDPYIQFFLDAVLKLAIDHNPDLHELLEWWEENKNKLSIIVPSGINAVQVMTIHKSKGLEFTVVIFPFATEEVRMKEKFWIDRDDAEIPELKTVLVNNSKSLNETNYSILRAEEESKSLLDLMNLMYVVMTRPTDRLYVFTSLNKRQKNPGAESVQKLMKYYLEMKNLWTDNTFVFKIGEADVKRKQDSASDESYHLKYFISNSWRKRILLSLQAPDYWDIEEPSQKQQWGSLVHYLLSMIKTAEDIEPALEKLTAEGILDEEEGPAIKKMISDFIIHPDVKIYFRDGLNTKIESEILLPDGHSLRPDRLIFEDDEVIVIDYKTGQPEESHHKQIKNYQKILKNMGYSNTEGVLLYLTQTSPVVKVTK